MALEAANFPVAKQAAETRYLALWCIANPGDIDVRRETIEE
ncbi:hypothetical protein GCM10011385_07440 [Nitratireductor aestuarii]|uniref:Uncharacterized protein n=1 Tax=Nitratireductor aestuarii TaxID=1735103 RepID=A0A916RJW2_9HYPH|nr:hypothetical protein GCM10011385_07440 [Nitratireductor aestuarii]